MSRVLSDGFLGMFGAFSASRAEFMVLLRYPLDVLTTHDTQLRLDAAE